jgi:hypothetical protein
MEQIERLKGHAVSQIPSQTAMKEQESDSEEEKKPNLLFTLSFNSSLSRITIFLSLSLIRLHEENKAIIQV